MAMYLTDVLLTTMPMTVGIYLLRLKLDQLVKLQLKTALLMAMDIYQTEQMQEMVMDLKWVVVVLQDTIH